MTDTIETLDSILSGESEPTQAEATNEGDKNLPEKDGAADPKGETTEPPAEEENEDEGKGATVPLAAQKDERRKRQQAEAEAKALREENAKLKAEKEPGDKAEKPKRPDLFEDPDGAIDHVEKSLDVKILTTKISLSRDMMMDAKADYEEKEQVFLELAKANPQLAAQMNASPNPAKFAYKTAENHLEAQKLNDPESAKKIRDEMRDEIRKELLAEMEQQQNPTPEAARKKSALNVPDFIKSPSSSNNATVRRESLDDVLRE